MDSPANKRLIEAIVDSENVRGNGFVARGVCARYEITFNEDENTTADLLDGKITFHQYITPFTPAEDIEDIIEFDPDALSAALTDKRVKKMISTTISRRRSTSITPIWTARR